MEFVDFIRDAKTKLERDDMSDVFELLNRYLSKSSDKYSLKELLVARYYGLEKDNIKGIVSNEEYRLENNRIRNSILNFLNLLGEADIVIKIDNNSIESLYEEFLARASAMDSELEDLHVSCNQYADKIDLVFNSLKNFSEGKSRFENFRSEEQLAIVGFEKMRVNMEVATTEILQGIDYKLRSYNGLVSILGRINVLLEKFPSLNEGNNNMESEIDKLKGFIGRFIKLLQKEMAAEEFKITFDKVLSYFDYLLGETKSDMDLAELSSCIVKMKLYSENILNKMTFHDTEIVKLLNRLTNYALSLEIS